MFALGLMSWLYGRPTEGTIAFLESKFAKRPEIAEANVKAFQAGYAFGETTESFAVQYEVKPAKMAPGSTATSPATRRSPRARSPRGEVRAAALPRRLPDHAGLGDARGARRYKNFGVRTFQAEDEIAAVGAALGAAFGGSLGVSTSSGPGIVLKQETIGLGITLELPL